MSFYLTYTYLYSYVLVVKTWQVSLLSWSRYDSIVSQVTH